MVAEKNDITTMKFTHCTQGCGCARMPECIHVHVNVNSLQEKQPIVCRMSHQMGYTFS